MVKRSVIANRSRKSGRISPRKKNKRKKRSSIKERRSAAVKNSKMPADVEGRVKTESDDDLGSVIVLDDTVTAPDTTVNDSCFIIDLEPDDSIRLSLGGNGEKDLLQREAVKENGDSTTDVAITQSHSCDDKSPPGKSDECATNEKNGEECIVIEEIRHSSGTSPSTSHRKRRRDPSESCICLDDSSAHSDSDVEFVESFNPCDRLIELSDGDDSVIIQHSEGDKNQLPTEISFSKKKRKKRKVKRDDEDKKEEGKGRVGKLRPIVIDGCNVGFGHSKRKGSLSVEGIKLCCDYFTSRGHEVKVFLPQTKLFSSYTSNSKLLLDMEKEGTVIFTPSRKVAGKCISSYDDRFIVEFATLKDAIIITRDNYRDLYDEKETFRDTIRHRLLQYTFVDDLVMFPDDPLGRNGPRLDEFLRFPAEK